MNPIIQKDRTEVTDLRADNLNIGEKTEIDSYDNEILKLEGDIKHENEITVTNKKDSEKVSEDVKSCPFVKYQKIPSFENAKYDLNFEKEKNEVDNFPVLDFTGTVKLHGTHGDILRFSDGNLSIQSRNRVLHVNDDNHGFAAFMTQNKFVIDSLFDKIIQIHGTSPLNHIMISGEWCGSKIQKHVALMKLPKMFVVFGINIDDSHLDMRSFKDVFCETANIYNIYQFPTYNVTIDFNSSTDVEELLANFSNEVERECPVCKHFGVSGTGEGIVWSNEKLTFKTKGVLMTHSKNPSSGISDISPKNENTNEFLKTYVSESRLNQGIEYLRELNMKITKSSVSTFIRWIENDIITEEKHTLDSLQLTKEEFSRLKKDVNNLSVKWFLEYLRVFHIQKSES